MMTTTERKFVFKKPSSSTTLSSSTSSSSSSSSLNVGIQQQQKPTAIFNGLPGASILQPKKLITTVASDSNLILNNHYQHSNQQQQQQQHQQNNNNNNNNNYSDPKFLQSTGLGALFNKKPPKSFAANIAARSTTATMSSFKENKPKIVTADDDDDEDLFIQEINHPISTSTQQQQQQHQQLNRNNFPSTASKLEQKTNIIPYLSLPMKANKKKKSITPEKKKEKEKEEEEDDIFKCLPREEEDDDWNFIAEKKNNNSIKKSTVNAVTTTNNSNSSGSSTIQNYFKKDLFNSKGENQQTKSSSSSSALSSTKFKNPTANGGSVGSDLLSFLPDCEPQPPSPKLPQATSLSNEEYLDSLFNKKKTTTTMTNNEPLEPDELLLQMFNESDPNFKPIKTTTTTTTTTAASTATKLVCVKQKTQQEKQTTPEKKQKEPDSFVEDPDVCSTCKIPYDKPATNAAAGGRASRSDHQKLIDSCGHSICFSCLLSGLPCAICSHEATVKTKQKQKSSPILLSSTTTMNRFNQQPKQQQHREIDQELADCFGESQMISYSPKLNDDSPPPIPICAPKFSKQFKIPAQEKAPMAEPKSAAYSVPLLSLNKIIVDTDAPRKHQQQPVVVNDSSDSDDIIIDECFSSNNQNTKSTTAPKPPAANKWNKFADLFETEETGNNDDDDIDEIDAELFKSSVFNKNNRNNNYNNNNRFNNNNQLAVATSGNDKTFGVNIPDIDAYEKIKWLFNDIKDCSPYYRSLDYPHTELMLRSFREKFGLKQFRPQQFEAVNAALLGHNCFILMPTGGGKSLCYQLPAILSAGVTFVVSPLKSLIIDQVQKLNALNLAAAHMLSDGNEKESSSSSSSSCDHVFQDLCRKEPTYRLVYVTPEKLNSSQKLMQILSNLYNRNMIARLVIDEAHCVSTWGHDFRKDYTQLGNLRNRLFPKVPVMLLTATATPRVRQDILVQMSLSCDESLFTNNNNNNNSNNNSSNNNRHYIGGGGGGAVSGSRQKCAFFIQSFNRENLIYQVEYKTSNNAALEKIVTLIKTKFANKSGIVYCISRNECESVRDFLRSKQIKALAYHAGMNDKDRAMIQHQWSNNLDCRVVCATIAFGMGIDKSDVRYVIHLGLPKSLEGYYQESGRAGRDGLVSTCLLFYNNNDRNKWLKMMKQEAKGQNYEVYKVHLDNLYRMSQYCDNRTDCRRTQILEYFGEIFDRSKCINSSMQTICDNCRSLQSKEFQMKDMSDEAVIICRGVQKIAAHDDVTLVHLSEILKGSLNAKIVDKGHNSLEMHGKLSKYKKTDIERIIRKLIFDGYLKEEVKVLTHVDTVASYLKVGPKAYQLLNPPKPGQPPVKIEIDFRDEDIQMAAAIAAKKSATATKKKSAAAAKSKNGNDDDDEESGGDIEDDDENSTTKKKDSSAENRILQRCKVDLLALAKQTCLEKGVKNMSSVFSNKMLAEMLIQMPRSREAMLRITYYTEAIYENYNGDAFLKIFEHYGKLIDDVREEEEKERQAKQAAAAAKKAAAAAAAAKISKASRQNSKTYGLLDDGDDVFSTGAGDDDEDDEANLQKAIANSIDYDFERAKFMESAMAKSSSSSDWMSKRSFKGKKRMTSGGSSSSNNWQQKRSKTGGGGGGSGYFSGGDQSTTSSAAGTSKKSYFKAKSKKKFWNFKKKRN